MERKMLEYLQKGLSDAIAEMRRYGFEDRVVIKKFDALIAQKELVEMLIGKPVNLGQNGIVSVGY